MSEPLAEHLSRFTPDATGLERDALLFAAGRASVPSNRTWQALAGALTLSQVLTLVCLWPHTPPPAQSSAPSVVELPATVLRRDETGHGPGPDGIWRAGMLSMGLDQPKPIGEEQMVPPSPPLRAFGTPPASILN